MWPHSPLQLTVALQRNVLHTSVCSGVGRYVQVADCAAQASRNESNTLPTESLTPLQTDSPAPSVATQPSGGSHVLSFPPNAAGWMTS